MVKTCCGTGCLCLHVKVIFRLREPGNSQKLSRPGSSWLTGDGASARLLECQLTWGFLRQPAKSRATARLLQRDSISLWEAIVQGRHEQSYLDAPISLLPLQKLIGPEWHFFTINTSDFSFPFPQFCRKRVIQQNSPLSLVSWILSTRMTREEIRWQDDVFHSHISLTATPTTTTTTLLSYKHASQLCS